VTKAGYGPWFKSDIRVSDAAKDLISKLLRTNVADRLTAEEALDHAWLVSPPDDQPIDISVLESIKSFNSNSKFKQAVCKMMAEDLSADVVARYREKFSQLDKNKDGTVSIEDLSQAIQHMQPGVSPESVASLEELSKKLDVNGDGVINYDEWLLFLVNRRLSAKEERLFQAFKKIDLDDDGKISLEELKAVLHHETEENLAQYLSEADGNHDGVIEYEEFLAIWQSKNAPAGSISKEEEKKCSIM